MTWLSRFLSRDAVAALAILVFALLTFRETFYINTFLTPTVGPELWPRIISVVLVALSLLYLALSLLSGGYEAVSLRAAKEAILAHRNPIFLLLAFLLFLLSMPVLGMPLGLLLFSFASMAAIGRRDPRSLLIGAAVTLVFVGGMILIFSYGLLVFFPEGHIIRLR